MKITLINIARKILHYLWMNRATLYGIYEDYRKNPNTTFDGKLTFKELVVLIETIKKSGLIVSEDEKIYTTESIVWGKYKIENNPYKHLVFTQQGSVTCAIYATWRAITYNTGIDFDKFFYQKVIERAKSTKRLSSTGMTFDDAMLTWKEIIREEMGLDLKYEKQWIWSERYNEWKEKGYANIMWGYIFTDYLIDREDDGIINIEGYNWAEANQYWHAWMEAEISHHIDNYSESKTIKYNEYYNKFTQDFIKKRKFFWWARFPYIEESIIDDGINLNDARLAKSAWIWNWKRPQKTATREEVAAMVYRA